MHTRQQLTQHEIDQVLGNYELGSVRSINELAAGSTYSPKVIVETVRGKLLLKRRARGLDLPPMVASSHEIILGCLKRGLCVPPLLATKANNSMVQFEDHVYELFVFIDGIGFDRSPARNEQHCSQAGALLAETHASLASIFSEPMKFAPPTEPVAIDCSRAPLLDLFSATINHAVSDRCKKILGYGDELARANASKPTLIHGDWHPGNMIYRDLEIVSACDFDNTRIGSCAREIAQAMVHFSMIPPTQGQNAANCTPEPQRQALRAFWTGYQTYAQDHSVCMDARICIGLMPAAMLDEALAMLAAQQQRAWNAHSAAMLLAVCRKACWMDEHQSELISLLETN